MRASFSAESCGCWIARGGAAECEARWPGDEALLLDSVSGQASVPEVLDAIRFQLVCERGKRALGEGDNSLGARVPGLFVAAGLRDVAVYVNDKATAIFPPYSGREQEVFVEDVRDRAARRLWNWSEAETRRFFLAGGGSEAEFPEIFARGLAARQKVVEGLADGSYDGAYGGGFYFVAGRKPAA